MAFRLSPEEADLLDTYVRLSGLTKQDYITRPVKIGFRHRKNAVCRLHGV